MAAMARQEELGRRIWRSVEAGADEDIAGFASLLADTAKAERPADVESEMATAHLAWDWQFRGAGAHRGFTPIMLACERGDAVRAQMLIEHGAAIALPLPFLLGSEPPNGQRADSPALVWSHAIDHGQLHAAQLVMAAMNAAHMLSETLQRAVGRREHDTVRAVLEACAKAAELAQGTADEAHWRAACLDVVNSRGEVHGSGGCTLLGMATAVRDARMAKLLLQHNADAELSCADGFTPLSWATIHCDEPMAELLVLHGASDSAALTGRAHDWLSTHAVVSGGGRAGGESRAVGGAEQSLTQPSVQLLWDVQAIRMHAQPCAMVAMAAAPFANMPHLRGPPPQEHSPVQLGDSFLSALQRWRSNGGSTAREMLHQHPQLSVLHSPKGQSALCRACAAGAAQIARGILRHAGADPNCLVEAGGASALMIAVAQKDHTLVELLIAAGANVSYVAMRGPYIHRQALDIALRLRRQTPSADPHDTHSTEMTEIDLLISRLHRAKAATAVEEEAERELTLSAQQRAQEAARAGLVDESAAGSRGRSPMAGQASKEAEEVVEGEAAMEGDATLDALEQGTNEMGAASAGENTRGADGSFASEESAESEEETAESEEESAEDFEAYGACSRESTDWNPEVRLYGVGRGLGQGISLLGRPFHDEADATAALEGAKSMAHMLRAIYGAALEEEAPDLTFEERSGDPSGSTCGPADSSSELPALGADQRIWQYAELLDGPDAAAPSTPPPALAGGGGTQVRGAIAPGSKDKRRLRRGPSTGGGASPTMAIGGG